MTFLQKYLKEDEKAIYNLRALYSDYGYTRYKVNQFEEYDLYAKNKSFLVSENLLTFTDTNGKLMALKPDVTLSIIKNVVSDERSIYKLFYDEQVYRTTSNGDGFKEIRQTGLESIGNLDLFSECEVLMLAMKSLENISQEYLLDLSHMGLLEGLFEESGVQSCDIPEFLSLIGAKNLHGLSLLCSEYGIAENDAQALCELTAMYLPIGEALKKISSLIRGEKMSGAFEELAEIFKIMKLYGLDQKLYMDFSVVNDMNYYDGIIFNGFINNIPDSVLSGGRYDRMMERFGKKTGAIGFAVYLDRLERIGADIDIFDVDYLLLYDDSSTEDIVRTVAELSKDGSSVRTQNNFDSNIRYRNLVKLGKDGSYTLETNG